MRYTNAARPIVGILEENTLARLFNQLQDQCPALFNLATPMFFSSAFLAAGTPRLVQPIRCARKVLDAVWQGPSAPDLTYLATRIDPSMLDLSKVPAGLVGVLSQVQVCFQVETIQVNFNPAALNDRLPLPASLQPFMGPQCFALQIRIWVGMLDPKAPISQVGVPLIFFPLELHAVAEFRLERAGQDLLIDAALRAIEIVDLKPTGLESMIKYYVLRTAADQIARRAPQLVLPADLLSIDLVKDLLYKEGEDPDTDRPSIILRVSFGAQILPSGPGSPEIDHDRVRIVLVPDSMREEVL